VDEPAGRRVRADAARSILRRGRHSENSHTFTTDDDAIDETIDAGQTVDITLTGVTTGGFHCRFHSQMVGTLTVG
jgi:plastocyanin